MDAAVSVVTTETSEKPYTLRKLQARDLIPAAKIIGKLGLEDIVSCYADEDFTELLVKLKKRRELTEEVSETKLDTDSDQGQDTDFFIVGATAITRVANMILLNLERCMDDVFAFLGGLSGLSQKEVSELDLDIFLQMLMDIFTGNDLVNFFRAAKKFIE